jgi:hypothetical protein
MAVQLTCKVLLTHCSCIWCRHPGVGGSRLPHRIVSRSWGDRRTRRYAAGGQTAKAPLQATAPANDPVAAVRRVRQRRMQLQHQARRCSRCNCCLSLLPRNEDGCAQGSIPAAQREASMTSTSDSNWRSSSGAARQHETDESASVCAVVQPSGSGTSANCKACMVIIHCNVWLCLQVRNGECLSCGIHGAELHVLQSDEFQRVTLMWTLKACAGKYAYTHAPGLALPYTRNRQAAC